MVGSISNSRTFLKTSKLVTKQNVPPKGNKKKNVLQMTLQWIGQLIWWPQVWIKRLRIGWPNGKLAHLKCPSILLLQPHIPYKHTEALGLENQGPFTFSYFCNAQRPTVPIHIYPSKSGPSYRSVRIDFECRLPFKWFLFRIYVPGSDFVLTLFSSSEFGTI